MGDLTDSFFGTGETEGINAPLAEINSCEFSAVAQKDSSRATTAVIAVTLAGMASFLNLWATQPLLPLLATLFSASKAAVGMTVSASTIGVAISAPFCGALAEKIGRKRVIVFATFLLAVPTILAATAVGLKSLIFWRFLQGIVTPGIFGVTIGYITEVWPAGSVAKVMSSYLSGSILGGFLGRVFCGYAATHRVIPGVAPNWWVGFVVVGLCSLIFGALIAFWLPTDKKIARHNLSTSSKGRFGHLWNKQLVATYIVGFNVLFSLVATFTYISFHLAAAPYLLNPAQLSWLFVVYLVGLVVTPLGGVWITKVGSRRALITAVLAGMVGILLTAAPSLPVIMIGLVLCSSGAFICQCSASSYIQIAAPAGGRSSAAGVYICAYYIGGSVSGVLPGYLWRFNGWTGCVLLVLFVQAITMATAGTVWNTKMRGTALAPEVNG